MGLKKFKYVATDKQNQQVQGTYKAENSEQVSDYLRSRDLFVISINQDLGLDVKNLSDIQIGGISLKDRMLIVKQLSTMLRAGLPVVQALDILGKQVDNRSLQDQIHMVQKEVEGGSTLANSFKKAKIFSEIQLNLLAAGEKSGNLVEVIARIAEDMEKSNELRGKIRGAMIYPAIVFIAIFVVIGILMVFMIPTVENLYADFDASDQMPGITKFLIGVSNFVSNPIGLLVIAIVVIVSFVSFTSYSKTEKGKIVIGRLTLKMPVFGQIIAKMHLAQFGRLLSMLMVSGVSIIDALDIVSRAMSNPIFSTAVRSTISEVSKGVPLAVPLANSGQFPLIYTRMVSTGEQTGNLDKVLADMGSFYEAEVNELTDNLTKLMEPMILLLVGGMVGFLAVAVYLPIYQIGNVIT